MGKINKLTGYRSLKFFIPVLFILLFISCKGKNDLQNSEIKPYKNYEIKEIPLKGEASLPKSEFSGLTWFKENLILLPQYPFGLGQNNAGYIYKIKKTKILDFINGTNQVSVEPEKIKIIGKGLEKFNKSGQGYESIAFNGDDVYLTIESTENFSMSGYIVKGKIDNRASEIILDKNSLKQITPQADIYNLSDETIFIYKNSVYTLYEANGKNVNSNPYSHKFDLDLAPFAKVKFPNVEYRITDATVPDGNGNFWVINYMYSGDWGDLNPATDKEYGNEQIKDTRTVERLLQFEITDSAIIRTKTPAVQIKISSNGEGRNWEGLVRLESFGFLLISDYFPKTILGFLECKEE